MKTIATAVLVFVAVLCVVSLSATVVRYLAFHGQVTACAAKIDPVPPEKWHGGNAPKVPSRTGCP